MKYIPLCLLVPTFVLAQTPAPNEAQLGLKLAESGKCAEALPHLRKAHPTASDDKMQIGNWGVRCAMLLNQTDDALHFLSALRHDFPRDPAVQFLSVHVFSDLSIRASQELLFTNPSAYQVHQLNAESLETQGRWDDAMSEYRLVLEKNPTLPGIHYRIGRLILSKPETPTTFADAKKEFEAELAIDPRNPGAEYVLGEMARQQEQWPDAIEHFGKAAQLDTGFADALIGLGRSLIAAGKPEQAIAPLEHAVRLQPQNPTAHFHLATALRRAGKKEQGDKEFAVYKQTSERAQQMTHDVQRGVLGPQQVDPDAQPQ
ncbi:MAG TPA: tetratricopeptide repeat protein [Bryobacteraceae bacterium]|jgi:tetratricopeptide (TPR) repeat protein|nr:tetratricopeptide repeat protein [Bryobacteraceae bacterium]